MFRVFDPTPMLPPDASLEFEEGKYHVLLGGKRIKTGDVVEVDEDLMKLQHNPEKMMLALARIRAVIRGSVRDCDGYWTNLLDQLLELTKCH